MHALLLFSYQCFYIFLFIFCVVINSMLHCFLLVRVNFNFFLLYSFQCVTKLLHMYTYLHKFDCANHKAFLKKSNKSWIWCWIITPGDSVLQWLLLITNPPPQITTTTTTVSFVRMRDVLLQTTFRIGHFALICADQDFFLGPRGEGGFREKFTILFAGEGHPKVNLKDAGFAQFK